MTRAVPVAVALVVVGVALGTVPLGASAATTPVGSCTTITASGEYELTTDLTSTTGDCISIEADDVVLEGDGHRIVGGGVGAAVTTPATPSAQSNVTVRNLTATGFETGIAFHDVTGGEISNVSSLDNGDGISLEFTSDVVVADNTVRNATDGVFVTGGTLGVSEDNTLVGNELTDNDRGVFATNEVSDLHIERNYVVDNDVGIQSGPRTRALVLRNNTIQNNDDYGVWNRDVAIELDETTTIVTDDVVDARENFWGAPSGPSSPADPDAPFADPATGTLADGAGDAVSENRTASGVSNVRFDPSLGEAPVDESTAGRQAGC